MNIIKINGIANRPNSKISETLESFKLMNIFPKKKIVMKNVVNIVNNNTFFINLVEFNFHYITRLIIRIIITLNINLFKNDFIKY